MIDAYSATIVAFFASFVSELMCEAAGRGQRLHQTLVWPNSALKSWRTTTPTVTAKFRCRQLMMKPSEALRLQRTAIRGVVEAHRARNVRVFGSALAGTDGQTSGLDLLVDVLPGATLFDLGGLQAELESLLGVQVDLLTPADLPPKIRAKVLAEAQPV